MVWSSKVLLQTVATLRPDGFMDEFHERKSQSKALGGMHALAMQQGQAPWQ
jgi:hypothetical protein